ncbi:MAG: DUF483 domain-containing protein [Nanoarchaeota archaeon]|nr:DUF483 domain-containing protein [Nanoarchaeota archaeon]
MLLELKDNLGSLTKALEILYVLADAKPVTRQIFYNDKTFLDILSKNNLSFVVSDFKIIKHVDKTRNYSDKALKVSLDHPQQGHPFIYISKDKELAKKALKNEKHDDHYSLGRLLGYPDCCCRFFEKNFPDASKGTSDLLPFTFNNSYSINYPWQNNYSLRVFDISLLTHFPCSFHCEESKKIALRNLSIIEKHDTDIASYFRQALKCVVIYSEGIGVYSINRFKAADDIVEYSPDSVIPSCKNDFYNLLKRKNNIKVLGKNNFLIGNVKIDDPHTFFALFS